MQKKAIIDAIQHVLTAELNLSTVSAFSPEARLNEDLYLDSVLLMQLLINLEVNLCIEVPDTAFSEADFATVNSLADFLLKQSESGQSVQPHSNATGTADDEEFEDIKVHCFVSCLCEMIKADARVDHRPFYFGVWDADVVVDENVHINYHSENINHDFFKQWYKTLYGVTLTAWYQDNRSKQQNIQRLLQVLDNKTASQNVMVMLDMFLLPERENKFNQNPFPHYVLLENCEDPDSLMMIDPDFRWQGRQNKAQVLTSIDSPAVSGGYYFDSSEIRPTPSQAIYDYYIACFNADTNPMTDAVRSIIQHHISNATLSELSSALNQLPVLAIRKYAYEHGLAFFWTELGVFEQKFDEFEKWCDVIETLVETYKKIQFRAMKIASHDHQSKHFETEKNEIFTLLEQQDEREYRIKAQLNMLFTQWRKQALKHSETVATTCFVEAL
ncbi:phosphopantetheine-binding protein [Psychromonas sp. psych-6C06]|nr:phosphopantetheine-binding protein [Psychromonas sp. psych-6C06]